MHLKTIIDNKEVINHLISKNNNLQNDVIENKKYFYFVYNFIFTLIISISLYQTFLWADSHEFFLLALILLLLSFMSVLGGIVLCSQSDKLYNHFFERLFSNKNQEDSKLISVYKKFYFHISKSKQEKIINYFNSLSEFEKDIVNKYILNDGKLSESFFYNYCLEYINTKNKEELQKNKELLFSLIDDVKWETHQQKLLSMYIEKVKNKKYKSDLLNQAESILNEDNDEQIEINKQSIIRQI